VKTVEIDVEQLHANPVHRALRLIKVLRDAGIPAFGAIALEGVESGVLSIAAPDLATGKVVYSWVERPQLQQHRLESRLVAHCGAYTQK
jgi:hypothetical protein